MELLWDEANLEHIARHNVEDYEVEEALNDPDKVRLSAYNTADERRFGFIGKTENGRILAVALTAREGGWRPFMARDAVEKEKRSYRRQK